MAWQSFDLNRQVPRGREALFRTRTVYGSHRLEAHELKCFGVRIRLTTLYVQRLFCASSFLNTACEA